TPLRDQDSGCAAEKRQQHALGYQLSHQPEPSSAERRAHSEFAAPRHAAREQQIGRVRAGDQQHQSNGGEQNQKRLSYRWIDLCRLQWRECRDFCDSRKRFFRDWVFLLDFFADPREVRLRLLDRDPFFQTPDNLKPIIVRSDKRSLESQERRGRHRYPRVGGSILSAKSLRQHSCDREVMFIQLERLADYGCIAAKTALPKTVAYERRQIRCRDD